MRPEKAYKLVRAILQYDDDIARILTPHLHGKILSIGCGEGRVERRLQEEGWKIQGAEITPYKRSLIPVQRYNGTRLPFRRKSFDTVLLIYVVHHAKDPEALLKEACRVGKRVLILDHTYTNWLSKAFLTLYDGGVNVLYRMPLPFHFLRIAEWKTLLQTLPVQIEDSHIPTALNVFFHLRVRSSSD